MQRTRVPVVWLAFIRMVVPVIVFGGAWMAASASSAVLATYVLPPIPEVATAFADLVTSGLLWRHIGASLARVGAGFALAVVTAVPLGVLLGRYRPLFLTFEPIIELLRPVSPIAWIPLTILWFGVGEASKIFLVWLLAFFVILVNTIAGVMNVERRLVNAALTLGAREQQMFTMVVLPAALPAILTGMRLGLGLAFGAIVVAEMVAAKNGIGFMMERARAVINPAHVLIGMVLLGALGFALNTLFLALQRRWTRT